MADPITPVVATVKTDVSKVESTVKADVAAVQAVESGLSRTKLAWLAAAAGFVVGFLIHYV